MSARASIRWDRRRLAAVAGYAAVVGVLAATVVSGSLAWIERPFPGFFVMDNRVVPSIALEHWTGNGGIYQHQVVAIDGVPVASAAEVYARVRQEAVGRGVRYTLRSEGGSAEREIASMHFTGRDYAWVFGALALNGIIFTAVGLGVWMLGQGAPTTLAVTLFSLNIGLFCLTAMDLYGPGRFFRIHVTTEALLPVTLLHLTLVFPVARLGRHRRLVLGGLYLLALALTALYQRDLYVPEAYSRIHNFCMTVVGVTGAALTASGIHAYRTSASLLVRRRLGIVALGTFAGFAVPAWLLTSSGLFGGDRAINLAVFTAFVFPLSLAYAVLKHDLFEIDAFLRRATSYLVLTGSLAAVYALLVLGLGTGLHTAGLTPVSSQPLIIGLMLIFLLTPLRDRIQRGIDRLYHRTVHDARQTLERASSALVSTLDVDDIYTLTIEVICRSLQVEQVALWLRQAEGDFGMVYGADRSPTELRWLDRAHPLIARLRIGERGVNSYAFGEDGHGSPGDEACEAALLALDAELALPLGRGDLIGFLAIGRKASGKMFTLDDVNFLATFANQVTVALSNALAYRKIGELNVGLEQRVAQRTSELATALTERERAYQELQQSQQNLLRVEKMAAVGRLTAGIAHEINTPLGASLNALTSLEDLAEEYGGSIGDASVSDDDHREIATEILQQVRSLATWTNKAAGYIRSLKAHTRNLDRTEESRFDVAQVIENTRLLLAHRLRHSSCTLSVECPAGLVVDGDPGKLGQVLTNLLTNAIDAYEGHGTADGPIAVRVAERSSGVEIEVEDQGSGIPPEHLERIFEDLFTTKPAGRGTGLGLSISHAIVADCFGGKIEVTSAPGRGSQFRVVIPRRELVTMDHGGGYRQAKTGCSN